MTVAERPDDVEAQIASWRQFVAQRRAVAGGDVDELESHLRDQIGDLETAGLAGDEAFIIAVKRVGALDEVSREYAREHSERLWKQLVLGDEDGVSVRSGAVTAVVLAICAAFAVKVPALFGVGFASEPEFYGRNASVLVLPFLAAYFVRRHRPPALCTVAVAVGVAAVATALNVFPFSSGAQTEWLSIVHSGVALWLLIGLVQAGASWTTTRGRMDYVRFTGEWFVYYVLLALGGAVLCALTVAIFGAIALDAGWLVQEWIIPCGAAGAVVIAAWLVEAKQNVIENIAPVLTRIFTPLFTVLLIALIVAAIVQRDLLGADRDSISVFGSGRDLLILFDVVLIIVLALLLYSMSARDPLRPPGWFDRLQLVMIASAVVVDAIILAAMIARIGAFGFSANKVASLGLNLILLANLVWAGWLLIRFLRGRVPFATLERWQTSYLPVYFVWAAVVALVFPVVFRYA